MSLVKGDLVLAGAPFITLVGNGAGVTRELTARNAKVFCACKFSHRKYFRMIMFIKFKLI